MLPRVTGQPLVRLFVLLLLAIVTAGVLAAWMRSGRARAPIDALTVFAAADLALALDEITPRFERATGAGVTVVLGSTGNLARQIIHGAPADLFFSADARYLDELDAQGVLLPGSRTRYARGFLALVTTAAREPDLRAPGDLLREDVRRVAIASPTHAPYGRAAEEALRSAGLWEAVRPKLVYGENVRQALQFVQTGAADAGLVARSLVDLPDIRWALVDPALHTPLDQDAAVLRGTRRPETALAFLAFVTGLEGGRILERFGFLLPHES